MSLGDWVSESRGRMDTYGYLNGARASAFALWCGVAFRGCRELGLGNGGTNIYEKNWDVLLLLDTVRTDALSEVAGQYPFLDGYDETEDSLVSVGSTSYEWMDKTFTHECGEEIANTAYVTANEHAHRFGDEFEVGDDDFGLMDKVYEYARDDEMKCIPPRAVTDRAITTWRESNFDRMIVHYMQPHTPYRSLPTTETNLWDWLRIGKISREEAWEAYVDHLQWVLDDVSLLLDNLDADSVMISADHGELFGKFGIHGHHRYIPAEKLKTVPWVEVPATDTNEYEPTTEPENVDITDGEINERLRDLGYL